MSWFSHGYHGQRYCSWARTHNDDDGVAQHGGHTPNNRLTEKHAAAWFTAYFFGIGHPCYDQLTPVKTRYPLTKLTAHRGQVFFEVDR